MIKFDEEIAGPNSRYQGRFPALTTAEMKSEEVGPGRLASCTEHSWSIIWPPDATAGEVAVESAPYQGYTGTWDTIQSVPFAGGGQTHYVSHSGLLGATRVRATVTVTGSGVVVRQRGVRQ